MKIHFLLLWTYLVIAADHICKRLLMHAHKHYVNTNWTTTIIVDYKQHDND